MTVGTCAPTNQVGICFVAHNAYRALCGGVHGYIGGIERQQSLMARWLAARGHRVSMITWDEGPAEGEVIDGIRVLKVCRRDAGVPGLRFLWPRWTSLNAAMQRADAEVYYQNCGEYVTGQVAIWCRRNGRQFVYSVASDPDCDPALPEMHKLRERVLYRYGLRRADRIVVQTRKQERMLADGFGRESVVLPMPCSYPAENEYVAPALPSLDAFRVLWIGRLCSLKRPDWLVALAAALPDCQFDLVGPTGDGEYARDVVARAEQQLNITVHGPAQRADVPGHYKRAAVMVCTSAFEGFPNTFIEAWSHGLPIVSTFDPDGLIERCGLGVVAHDVQGLAQAIKGLMSDTARWRRISDAARQYYLANHTVEAVMPQFEKVLLEAAQVERSRGK